jgi:hypothetical protein
MIVEPGRTPDEIPEPGQRDSRDWHPDTQPGDDGTPEGVDHFTEDEADAIQIYIDQLKEAMGLNEWDIYLSATPSDEGTNASVHPVYGRRVVPISVNKYWFTYHPRVQRNTLVHELLHVLHNAQTEVIRTAPVSTWMWRTFERETELMVDRLAGIIDEFMPMPPTIAEVAEHRAKKTGPFAQ